MQLTFLGHAAFLIEAAGQRIITDPYSSAIGYAPIDETADWVTLSHDNPKWHSCLDEIGGDFQIVKGLELGEEVREIRPLRFGAVRVYENLPDDGANAMVWIEAEGRRILHMGDCGHALDEATIEKCGEVDILLALAGGPPTIKLPDLMSFVEKLRPRIVVPMHFGVPNLAMKALSVGNLENFWDSEKIFRHQNSNFSPSFDANFMASQLNILPPSRLKSANFGLLA